MATAECMGDKAYGKGNRDDYVGKRKEKRHVVREKPDSLGSAKMNNSNNPDEDSITYQSKKRLSVWTPELHQKFIKAVQELGENSTVSFLLNSFTLFFSS